MDWQYYTLLVAGRSRTGISNANTEASACTLSVSLSIEATTDLLQKVPAVYNTQINDVLLTALIQSYSQWSGVQTLLVDLEGHGREEIVEDIDLSRTVGWFTTIFPVRLNLAEISHPGEALQSIKEQLRCIPNQGIGYGLLRYLSPDAGVKRKLESLPQAEVLFNYLGQFDQVLSESSLFKLAGKLTASHSSQGRRSHLLEINAFVVEGRLQVDWTYSENVHQRATIQRFADDFVDALRSLINHCLSPEAGGHTPSDFPLARLNEKKLSKLASMIKKADGGKG